MRGMRRVPASIVCIAAVLLTGCHDTYNAVATCTNKADITSVDFGPSRVGTTSIGILNTHHFLPGDVIELIPPQTGQTLGTGSRIDTLKYAAATDFLPDDPPTTTSQVIATDFELTVDAELKAFTATIQSALKQNTQLTLTAGSRHALAHPLDIISNTSNQSIQTQIIQHPERLYVVVTGVVNGTDLGLQYSTNNNANASVNVLKLPGTKFSVNISYVCSNVTSLKSAGQSPSGLAFFYTTVAFSNGKVDTVTTADLTKYTLPNALL
jgi:hypothetical protein